jgi:hypothetical protein
VVLGAVHGEFDEQGEYWQPHLHLVASGMRRSDLNLIRKKHYRRSPRIYRPMVAQPVVSSARQLSYLLKSYWLMKIRYIEPDGRKKSTFQRIPEPYHSQYLIMLDQFNLLDFILLIGVRRYGSTLQGIPS